MDMAFDGGRAVLTTEQVAGDHSYGKPSRG